MVVVGKKLTIGLGITMVQWLTWRSRGVSGTPLFSPLPSDGDGDGDGGGGGSGGGSGMGSSSSFVPASDSDAIVTPTPFGIGTGPGMVYRPSPLGLTNSRLLQDLVGRLEEERFEAGQSSHSSHSSLLSTAPDPAPAPTPAPGGEEWGHSATHSFPFVFGESSSGHVEQGGWNQWHWHSDPSPSMHLHHGIPNPLTTPMPDTMEVGEASTPSALEPGLEWLHHAAATPPWLEQAGTMPPWLRQASVAPTWLDQRGKAPMEIGQSSSNPIVLDTASPESEAAGQAPQVASPAHFRFSASGPGSGSGSGYLRDTMGWPDAMHTPAAAGAGAGAAAAAVSEKGEEEEEGQTALEYLLRHPLTESMLNEYSKIAATRMGMFGESAGPSLGLGVAGASASANANPEVLMSQWKLQAMLVARQGVIDGIFLDIIRNKMVEWNIGPRDGRLFGDTTALRAQPKRVKVTGNVHGTDNDNDNDNDHANANANANAMDGMASNTLPNEYQHEVDADRLETGLQAFRQQYLKRFLYVSRTQDRTGALVVMPIHAAKHYRDTLHPFLNGQQGWAFVSLYPPTSPHGWAVHAYAVTTNVDSVRVLHAFEADRNALTLHELFEILAHH